MSNEPVKTPIEPSVIARITQGVRFALTGKTPASWMGPGQPLAPAAQDESLGARGRMFDYRVGINTTQGTSNRNNEGPSFVQLRQLADAYDLLRLVIETRKDVITALPWKIVPVDPDAEPDDTCKAITDFLQSPDREHDWSTWLRMLIEDMLVIDAATIYPRMNRGGGLYALELVDGGTIRRIIDATGRTPVAPDPAYQQLLKGVPAVNYSRDELIYAVRNPRTNRLYGFSPVEQIVMTVDIALRRQLRQRDHYTEGNVPDALIGVPEQWTPKQIQEMQDYWDLFFEGPDAQKKRRKAKFVPGGMTPTFTVDPKLKDEMDDWLARIVCFAFSISPNQLIAQVNRATAQTQQDQAKSEGVLPSMHWVVNVLNVCISRWLQQPGYKFMFDLETEIGPLDQSKIDETYTRAKIVHPDEVRERMGLAPLTPEQKADLNPVPVMGADGENPDQPGKPGAAAGAGKQPPGQDAEKVSKKKAYSLRR